MNRINNILVIVDPTASEHPCVEKAALLAERLPARLELFACDTKAAREARLAAHLRTSPGQPFQVDLKAFLESIAGPLRARGLDVTTETECADPLHVALVERTKHTTADLVVKDTHHHSLAQRTVLTNTDWNLIRSCPVPLLLTRTRPWATRPRIMAAVDPGHANDKPAALDHRILEHASTLARALGGELRAVHAYLPITLVAATTGGSPPMVISMPVERLAAEELAMRRKVQELVGPYGVAADHVHLELGAACELLPRAAQLASVDVVAMGAISRTGLKRIFLGATAEDVLERLPCDSLIVKSPDFAEMLPF